MILIQHWTCLTCYTVSMFAFAFGDTTVTIGFLGDSSITENSVSFCQSDCWEEKTRLEMWSFIFDSENKTTLLDAAKHFNKARFDIVISHIRVLDLNYLHNVLHDEECLNASFVSEYDITDWVWYHRIQNNTLICDTGEKFVRNQCSNKRDVAEFLADLITNVGWKYVSVFYDTDYDREATLIADMLSSAGVRIHQYNVHANNSNLPSIATSYHMIRRDWKHYLLLANRRTVETVLDQLNAFDAPALGPTAMKTFSLWIIWGNDIKAPFLEDKVGHISNVVVLERPVCDTIMSSPPSTSFQTPPFERMCNPWLYNAPYDRSCNESDVKSRAISRISRAILSILSREDYSKSLFKLSTAVWKPEGRRFESIFQGNKDFLNMSLQELFPNSKYGLNKMELIVTTLPWPLYVIKSQNEDGKIQYEGMCLDLLSEMAHQLNFTYTIQEPLDQEWGRYLDDKWTGLIGDIVYHKADLIVAPVSIQEERVAVVDFTMSFFTDYNTFMTRMPDKEKTRWLLLLRPLTWQVLVTIAAVFPVTVVSLWLCERFSPFYSHFIKRSTSTGLHHLHESIWYMFGALTTKCGMFLPRASSGRTIVTFWWLFVVLMVAAYCGNLMAFLTVSRQRKPFNTIAELLQRPDYKWGVNNGTYLLEILKVRLTYPEREGGFNTLPQLYDDDP